VLTDPPGTLLPTGGVDHGHKGYNLALTIEALSQGLSGYGRADGPDKWGASVWLQVMDPAVFGGRDAFLRQSGWLAEACRATPPAPGVERVRLPGEAGLARKRQALDGGVRLYSGIMEALEGWAGRLGVAPPRPRAG
jgi:LDH2 family malate/lactate/ureidoglycolate dehydrogenase